MRPTGLKKLKSGTTTVRVEVELKGVTKLEAARVAKRAVDHYVASTKRKVDHSAAYASQTAGDLLPLVLRREDAEHLFQWLLLCGAHEGEVGPHMGRVVGSLALPVTGGGDAATCIDFMRAKGVALLVARQVTEALEESMPDVRAATSVDLKGDTVVTVGDLFEVDGFRYAVDTQQALGALRAGEKWRAVAHRLAEDLVGKLQAEATEGGS